MTNTQTPVLYRVQTIDSETNETYTNSALLSSVSHWHVKGFSPKHIAVKVDAIGPENTLFAGVSVHLSARKFYRLGQLRFKKSVWNHKGQDWARDYNDNNNNVHL